MRAAGPTAPKFGPKQTAKNHPRDVGIGGGPEAVAGKGMGKNPKTDPGLRGKHAATADNDARSGKGTGKHKLVTQKPTDDFNDGATVKGQGGDGPGRHGVASYNPKKRDGGAGHEGRGDDGFHGSTKKYNHDGYQHTSKHR